MKWVTRSHVDVGSVACCWLILRFVDSDADFLFCPSSQVDSMAEELGAIPFDVHGVELSGRGGECSFEVIVAYYGLTDDALLRLASAVRGAAMDNDHTDPVGAGLRAIALGYGLRFPDDQDNLDHQLAVFDSVYAWCRLEQAQQGGEEGEGACPE